MVQHYADSSVTLHHGDCLDVLREMADASVDAIVTDPPYGLGFMGKAWDDLPPGLPWAQECLRVLKPGGHLLAFGGSRTWHRLAVAVEDAGFEIRDSLAWLYGSGFPKSLDVSKAIDKAADYRLKAATRRQWVSAVEQAGLTLPGNSRHDWTTAEHAPGDKWWAEFQQWLPSLTDEDRQKVERAVVGQRTTGIGTGGGSTPIMRDGNRDITSPATPDAKRWQGWGTALKPAFEPIVVGRKPLAGTVAANVLAHGTGALNIDRCRVGDELIVAHGGGPSGAHRIYNGDQKRGAGIPPQAAGSNPRNGRWPANVVLDESQASELDAQSGASHSRVGAPRGADSGDGWGMTATGAEYDDQGGASRFFYVAKADQSERVKVDGIAHPTVKPLDIMRWLVRLVTPPGGTVLEPFAGSGTTVEACILEGFQCIAIEREADYLPLIVQRINRRRDPVAAVKATGDDGGLFDLLGA